MTEKYYARINYEGDIADELIEVAEDFEIGEYKRHSLIEVGYEDFNLKLTTSTGNYFVKIFASNRTDSDIERYVSIMNAVTDAKIPHPTLLKSNTNDYLFKTVVGLELVVMQWLDGPTLYDLQTPPISEIRAKLAEIAAKIAQINFKPQFLYDSWSVQNFAAEFKLNQASLTKEDDALVSAALQNYLTLDLNNLPEAFVHGDIISTNVMISDSRPYVIDFSVANWQPRINELAVLASNLFFDLESPRNSQSLLDELIREYSKHATLTDQELAALPIIVDAAHAMHVVGASKTIAQGDHSDENQFWLESGRSGLGA